MRTEAQDLLDRSLKLLTRRAAPALCRLAAIAVDPAQIRFEDTAVNVAEHRADTVLLLGAEDDPDRWGWHLEYQLEPDPRVISGWLLKNAIFNSGLGLPVVLTVLYLTRGDRATFPDRIWVRGGGRANDHGFDTLRLWEHAELIASGALPELAPLLALCEANPGPATLQREREMILGLDAPQAVKSDLLAVALMVGLRFFDRGVLESVFREELLMLKEVEFIHELFADEIADAGARGAALGEARGEAQASRRLLLGLLQARFGALPANVVARIEQTSPAECEALALQLLTAGSLAELGL